ncbi:STAS domain-containing protein [Micromonospora sp. CPCC 205371]|nr:STAS domain-containing protein [Micromonospora sp. CPCC 205371]
MDVSVSFDVTIADGPDGCRVVRLDGELDMATAPQVSVALDRALATPDGAGVILDLTNLRFLDASGITVFVNAYRLATRQRRTLRACGACGEVEMVLRVTDVADLLGLPQIPADVASTEKLT